MMKPFERGDMLRLMTQKEVFGKNYYDADEEDANVTQFEPMKDRRNRIAYLGKGGATDDDWQWWWLSNQTWLRDVVNAANFADVGSYGVCSNYNASNSCGVRPAFKISLI